MKSLLGFAIALVLFVNVSFANNPADVEAVKAATLNYIEGFYEGDDAKLRAGLSPELNKHGFWKDKKTGMYKPAGDFPFSKALSYAKNVRERKQFAKPGSPKEVDVLEVSDKIAITKATANWGVDYMLLAKNDGKWMIRQVLWEGPDRKSSPSEADIDGARKAGLNYIEGFYEGDLAKLTSVFKPATFKFGYPYDKKNRKYGEGTQFTYEKALNYIDWVNKEQKYAKSDAIKEVEVLDVMNHTAAIKVTANWGIDYMLLSRDGDNWKIEHVLWSSLPPKEA